MRPAHHAHCPFEPAVHSAHRVIRQLRQVIAEQSEQLHLQLQLHIEAVLDLEKSVESARCEWRVSRQQRRLLREQDKVLREQRAIIAAQRRQLEEQAHAMRDYEEQHQQLLQRLRAELDKLEEQAAAARARDATIEEQAGTIEALEGKLAAATAALQALERRTLGPKSEKMPPVGDELRQKESEEEAEARRLRALERRRERQALRDKMQRDTVIHHVDDEDKLCPECGGIADSPLGDGKRTTMFEYVPGYFVRQEHVQEKLACRCHQHIVTAPPPVRALDKSIYGPGFIAHLMVMKCADSIPLYRLAKQYQRLGIPMSRSTLTDLFHRAADKLAPLYQRLLALVANAEIVQADETSMKMQQPNQRGFVWNFLAEDLIAYRFSASRSGETPRAVLGGTKGTLVVDAYTGYNRVTDVDGRTRSGCLAHIRRKIFEALPTAEVDARRGLDLILDIYALRPGTAGRLLPADARRLR
jgi:transposase